MPSRRTFLQSSIGVGVLGLGTRAFAQAALAIEQGARLAATGFRGEIVTPASPRYEDARRMTVTNPRRSARPQIIAICADEDDVRRSLAFARKHSLELAVRSGGHDILAASICNGFVIDLSALQTIQVDADARTVRVGAGVRAGPLNAALAERGFVAALGAEGRVGVAGLTLGGGLGWFAGRHGATCDHLIAARLVTADGRVLRISSEHNPDLLWALRGGGGNFGIVTEFTFAVHPMPRVTQGIVALRGDQVADFIRRHRDYLASAGDNVDLETFIFAPKAEPLIFIKASYSGDPDRADRALAPLRRLAPFVADDLSSRPYTGLVDPAGPILPLFVRPVPPRQPGDVPGTHWGAISAAPLSDAAAEIIADRVAQARGGGTAIIGQHIHGAAAGVPPGHSALRRIDGLLNYHFSTSWRRPADADEQMAWVDGGIGELQPHAAPGYINLLSSDDPAVVKRAYGDNYPRLAAIKRVYDPDNIFRRNRNITPA